MPETLFGLPTHALVVHAVVVLVPLAAVATAVMALWPLVRRRYGVAVIVLDTLALLSVPVASHSGEWLYAHVADSALATRHAHMGDGLLPFAGLLWVVAIALWWVERLRDRAGRPAAEAGGRDMLRVGSVALSVAALVLAGACVVQVVRIGHSGAQAAWSGRVLPTPRPGVSTG